MAGRASPRRAQVRSLGVGAARRAGAMRLPHGADRRPALDPARPSARDPPGPLPRLPAPHLVPPRRLALPPHPRPRSPVPPVPLPGVVPDRCRAAGAPRRARPAPPGGRRRPQACPITPGTSGATTRPSARPGRTALLTASGGRPIAGRRAVTGPCAVRISCPQPWPIPERATAGPPPSPPHAREGDVSTHLARPGVSRPGVECRRLRGSVREAVGVGWDGPQHPVPAFIPMRFPHVNSH